MSEVETPRGIAVLRIEVQERSFPPYDPYHGTPETMLWRRVRIETAAGVAVFEQTDYGHAGRLNPWEPRGVSSGMAPQIEQLRALLGSLSALL